jgi:predicted nuclease of restriction endonuclease-like (RecB) superfamily
MEGAAAPVGQLVGKGDRKRMAKQRKSRTRKALASVKKAGGADGYTQVLGGIADLLEAARRAASRSVNAVITATYWEIGRRIVEFEQAGAKRAEYGEQLIDRLSADLGARFGRGFGRRNLFQIRAFYLAYREIVQTPSAQLKRPASSAGTGAVEGPGRAFSLPWSHYVRLLSVDNENARRFYEAEALRGGWSIRQLHRQITTQFYERTALSKNKAAMLTKHAASRVEDAVSPEEEIKDPLLLEFLDLKDEYSESDLEEALIRRLEEFLLELGGDFAFVGRQRRLRVADAWYRIDLLFFHRRLRCLVIIDLKLGELAPQDAGQMHMYLNYAREHWTHSDENPPVGLILCSKRHAAVAKYALEGLPNKVLASEYRTTLPNEKLLSAEIERERQTLEARFEAQAIIQHGMGGRTPRPTSRTKRRR